MLISYILQQVQRFERRHGVQPNVVYMNEEHYLALAEELPGLFCDQTAIQLGFRIAILSKESISHPQVALIEQRKEVGLYQAKSQPQSLQQMH